MQQRVQTDATFNIQQCWELLANNGVSVCWGLTRPSRSMHFGDVSQTNGPRDPKRMGRAENEA